MIIMRGGTNDHQATLAAERGEFVPTEYATAAQKKKCFNWLKRFMLAGCPKSMWRKETYNWLYKHLFGHIAHYNMDGFWYEWFERKKTCIEWVAGIMERSCYGSPTHTWSDVEVAIQNWLKEEGNLERVCIAIQRTKSS